MKTIEYKVRPVTRFIVTRFEQDGAAAGSSLCGEFDREEDALRVGFALAKNDLDHYGAPRGDEGTKVLFPDFPEDWTYYPST